MAKRLGPSHRRLLEYLASRGEVLEDPEGKIRARVSTDLNMTLGALSMVLDKCRNLGHIEMEAIRGKGTTRLALTDGGRVALLNGSHSGNENGSAAGATPEPESEPDDLDDDEPEILQDDAELEAETPYRSRTQRVKVEQVRRDRKIQDLHDTNARLEQRI